MKVFFMKKMGGTRRDRLVGYSSKKAVIKVKISPPYNLTGEGYETVCDACKSNGYQKDMLMCRYGRFVKTVGGSSSTYRCDYYYINTGIVAIALVGGNCRYGAYCGAYVHLAYTAGNAAWVIGASPSCEQPLAA